jgi:hypothetical protein
MPTLTEARTRDELCDVLEQMTPDELTAYATESLTVATLIATVLERRYPSEYEVWSALVKHAIDGIKHRQ